MSKDHGNLYASEQTQRNFPWLADAIGGLAPNTNVMAISKSDIYTPPTTGAYASIWSDQEDWSRLWGDVSISSREDVDFWKTFNQTEDNLMSLISSHSEGESPFIPKDELMDVMVNNYNAVESAIYSATSRILKQNYASLFLPEIIGSEAPSCIITLPQDLLSAQQMAAVNATISETYLNDITGTKQDWAIFTVGHEIAGHCHNGHHYDDNVKYNSIEINLINIDTSIANETEADINGSNFYYTMQNKGIASSANVPAQQEYMRALGNLLGSGNNYTVSSNDNISEHITTIGYDPTQENATSHFNIASLAGISSLPLLINTYADSLIGFTYAQYINERIEQGELSDLDEETITFYENLTNKPDELHSQLENFAELGLDLRSENPQMHYTAINFLQENNAFDSLKSRLLPEYGMALDDLIQDYLEAVDTHAHALKDDKAIEGFNAALTDKIDFVDITDIVLITHDYPTASPNQTEQDIHATLPVQAIIPLNINIGVSGN